MIPEQLYRQIISVIPILCVDVIIRNEAGRYLLVRRRNEPLKGDWWVVGGRILQGEYAHQACVRKILEEVGLETRELHFLGFYEDMFDKNSFDVPGIYHTLSLVFETQVTTAQIIQLDNQHSAWGWFDELPSRFVLSAPNNQ